MHRDISDELWNLVSHFLEKYKRKKSGGKKPIELRTILNGVIYLMRTGCQWECIPACYGSKSAIHEHFQKWVADGVYHKIFQTLLKKYDEDIGIEWEWQSMDGFLVQAPVRGQTVCLGEEALGRNPTDRGRSGCKGHVHVDANGIPVGVIVEGANVHDSRLVSSTLAADAVERPKPTEKSPQHICLDKGYDYKRVDLELAEHSLRNHTRRIGEEKLEDGEKKHPARRWVVERSNAWLKGFRAVRTRYFCQAQNYLAIIHLACAIIIFRKLQADTA